MSKKLIESILSKNLLEINKNFEEVISKKLKNKLKSKKGYEVDNTNQLSSDNSGANELCSSVDSNNSGAYIAYQTNERNEIQRIKKYLSFADHRRFSTKPDKAM